MNKTDYNSNLSLNLKANGDTVIAGKYDLIAVVINTKGGSSNTLKIYDNTAGTDGIRASIDTTASVGRLEYGIPFLDGIHIVIATGTAPDITVIYRESIHA
jgi:hypothetical protein